MADTSPLLPTGPDNFARWLSSLEDKIEREDLESHLLSTEAELKTALKKKYPVSTESTASEQFKQTELLDKVSANHRKTRVLVRESLSQEILNGLTTDLKKGEPMDLLKALKVRYGIVSRARQAELWAKAWSTHAPEGEDPTPVLNDLRALFDSMIDQVKTESGLDLPKFLEQLRGFVLLRALPPSFDHTANAFYAANDLDAQSIITTIESTWRRKMQREEDFVQQALLAHQSRASKRPARPLAPNGKPFRGPERTKQCVHCLHFGHTRPTCHQLLREQASANIAEIPSSLSNTLGAPSLAPSSQLATLHNHASLTARLSADVIVDTGATNTFIRDGNLLTNLKPLASPIPVATGNGGSVTAAIKISNCFN